MENDSHLKEQFHNDLIDLTVHKKPHCLVEFDVIAKPALVKKSHSNAIKTIAKQSSIPGFRKGKAPDDLVVKKFPKAVSEEWQKSLAQETFNHCESLAKVPLLSKDSKISFKMKSFSEETAEMSFSFESEPFIPEFNYKAFKLPEEKESSVDSQKLEETLHRIRLFFSKWQEVKDRGVQLGDFVVVDVDLIEDDGSEKKAFSQTRLEVSEKNMAQWMRDIILGMTSGEVKEGISKPDDDATDEDKKNFSPKKVRVSLKTIEEPILPPVDDDLAKKVGVETASVMKERLSQLLKNQAQEELQKALREDISQQLLEQYQFDLPKSLLDKEISYRMHQLQSSPADRKHFNSLSEEEKQEERNKVTKQAEKAVRLFYLCKKVVTDNKLTFSPDELTKNIKTPLDAMFVDRDLLNPNKTEDQKAMLMSRLMLSTAQDYIISKIKELSS